MKKLWKRFALFAGIFLATVLTALLVLPYLISMERLREPLSQRISMMLNRPVSMEKIRMTLIPYIGLNLIDFRIGEQSPDEGVFMNVETLELHLRFLPLLKGNIQVGAIELENPVIQIIRYPNGQFNYQTLGVTETIRTERKNGNPGSLPQLVPVSLPETANRSSESPWMTGLLISRATVSNGTVHFEDRSADSPTVQEIREIDLTIHQPSFQEPVSYSLSARFGKGKGLMLKWNGRAIPNLPEQSLTLENNRVILEDFEFLLEGSMNRLFSGLDLHLILQSQTLRMEDLETLSGTLGSPLPQNLTLKGDAALQMTVKGPFRALEIAGNVYLDQTHYAYANLLHKEKGVPAKISIKSTLKNDAVTLHDLTLDHGASDISLQGIITKTSPPDINLSVYSNRLEGQTWLFPAATVSGMSDRGKASGPPKKTATPSPPPVKAHVNIQIQKGEIKGYSFSNLKAMVNFKEGILRVSPLSFRMAEGIYQGQINMDLNHPAPPFQFSAKLKEMSLTELFTLKPSLKKVLQGRLFTELSLKGKGLSLPEIQKTAEGQGMFKISDGKLPKLKLREEVTALLGFSPDVFGNTEGTSFRTLRGSFFIGAGKIHTDDLHMALDGMALAGKGYVSLDRSLSFKLTAEIDAEKVQRGSLASGLGKTFLKARNGNVIIPMKVSGTVTSPKIKPDTEAVANLATRNLLDKAREEIQKQGGVENLLKGLFQSR